MSRLIDADELMEILRANRYYPFGVSIDEVPTVDAVQVIRCKDCQFNYGIANEVEFNPDDIVCTYFETDGMHANDYCSRAGRKEE